MATVMYVMDRTYGAQMHREALLMIVSYSSSGVGWYTWRGLPVKQTWKMIDGRWQWHFDHHVGTTPICSNQLAATR